MRPGRGPRFSTAARPRALCNSWQAGKETCVGLLGRGDGAEAPRALPHAGVGGGSPRARHLGSRAPREEGDRDPPAAPHH